MKQPRIFWKKRPLLSLKIVAIHNYRGENCSGLPKVIFLAVAKAEGEGGKTSALEVEAEGEAEGLVFCI